MRIHCLQHVAFEGPASIAEWATAKDHAFRVTRLFEPEPLPTPDEFDWLIVMGGPMSAHDESRYAWLAAEKQLIKQTLIREKRMLGVCLGAQLLAEALGGRVFRGRSREIGWFPVRRGRDADSSAVFHDLPAEFVAFHWHGEAFDLPAGALHLAQSDGCDNQAFESGSAVGLLFHLEVTRASVQALIEHCGQEIGTGAYEQSPDRMLADAEAFDRVRTMLWNLLERIAATKLP